MAVGRSLVFADVAAPGGDTRALANKLHRVDPAVIRADFDRAQALSSAANPISRRAGKTGRVIYRFRKPAARTAADF